MQADFFLWSKPVLKSSDIGGQCPMALDELLIQHLEDLQIESILQQFW